MVIQAEEPLSFAVSVTDLTAQSPWAAQFDRKVLTFDGPIADFALAPDAQGVFQGVMGLALVETNLGTALHVGIKQPVDDEECALDAANFTQGWKPKRTLRQGLCKATRPGAKGSRGAIAATCPRGCRAMLEFG